MKIFYLMFMITFIKGLFDFDKKKNLCEINNNKPINGWDITDKSFT